MATKENTYTEAVGRRKTATARVRITPAKSTSFEVNEKTLADYFVTEDMRRVAEAALKEFGGKFTVTARISGGGLKAQAEALRHGLSRALVKYDGELRGQLKQAGFLRRDPRMKERKKFGLRSARRAPQWSKR